MIVVEIAGHLGKDPESRVTPSGQKVTNLNVATNVRQGDKDETIWWRVTIWGSEWDNFIKNLKKGSAIIVIGDMGKLDIYTDKEGRPQIGYQMTGRMLKFSPFGRTDRPEGTSMENRAGTSAGASAGYSASTQQYAAPQMGTGNSFIPQSTSGAYENVMHYAHDSAEEEPPF